MMSACKSYIYLSSNLNCRFFTPTIEAMKQNQNLYILVLSNGGYDGLGKIREKEMEKAANYMGFKDFHIVGD